MPKIFPLALALAVPQAAAASVVPSCWGILAAVQSRGEAIWLDQCVASLHGERRSEAIERCRGWLAECRRNPFPLRRPGTVTY